MTSFIIKGRPISIRRYLLSGEGVLIVKKMNRSIHHASGFTRRLKIILRLPVLAAGILLLFSSSCKNSTGPDFFEVTLVAYNNSGTAVDIFLDDEYRITLEYGASGGITGVSNGSHQLIVKQKGLELLITTQQIVINEESEYTWVIDGPSSIKITNNYGEALRIYSGSSLMGDIENNDSQSITEVPFGTHELLAVRISDLEAVKAVTIVVTEVKEYTWIISP